MAAVPLARPGSSFTRAFEDVVVHDAIVGNNQAAADRHGVSSRAVNNMRLRVAVEALGRVDLLDGLVAIAIDEVKYKKGHKYLTVVCDHVTGRVIWAAKGRSTATVNEFFDALGDRAADLDFVTADGAEWIRTVVAVRAPNAIVCIDTFHVIGWATDEAERRDPHHRRTWVGLVDGNNHHIDRFRTEATERGITLHIVCDFVHVLEYLWSAAWSFYDEGDPTVEQWVQDNAIKVLDGHATRVAAAIRRKATYHHQLSISQRANADRAANYLTNKAPYLDYPTALTAGWPIATGVIDGCAADLTDRDGPVAADTNTRPRQPTRPPHLCFSAPQHQRTPHPSRPRPPRARPPVTSAGY